MKSNAYFEELDRIARDFEQRHEAHKALKQEIINTKGWDSEELNAWYAEEERDFQYPISSGICKAFRAFENSDGDEVLFDDFCWEREYHDFIDAFRKAGLKTFVITGHCSALMENLHGFAAEGCKMEGLCTITKKSHRWGTETEEQIPGIRIIL